MPPAAAATIRIDDYVVSVLLPDLVGHDRRPAAFIAYLALWRITGGGRLKATVSLRTLAGITGLSKRAIQDALDVLTRRRLLTSTRSSPTAIPVYQLLRPWAARKHSAARRR